MDNARIIFDKRMNWLKGNRIGISQRPVEFYEVWKQVYELQPKRIIEIGSHTGGSLYMYAAASKCPAEIIVIDKPFERAPRTKQLKFIIGKLKEEGHKVTHYSGSSTTPEFITGAKNQMPVADFVHIDGCHDYHFALADWTNYGTLVRDGGLVALHDLEMKRIEGIDTEQPGVGRLYSELMEQGYIGTRHVQYKKLGKLKVAGIGLIHVEQLPEIEDACICIDDDDKPCTEDCACEEPGDES
jgi:cephalosporin hydroxylase